MFSSAQWILNARSALYGSKLSDSRKLTCTEVLESFKGLEYALRPTNVGDNFQLEITINKDNTQTTLQNTTQWVRDSFVNKGVSELDISIDEEHNFATVVVRANAVGEGINDGTLQPGEKSIPATNPNTTITQQTPKAATSVASVPAEDPSENSKRGVFQAEPNTSEFFLNVEVYLEGVQIPHSSATISYGIGTPPSCTIIMPASSILRDLPETTKVHIFFEDMLPDERGEYHWRLLFDGELAGFQYSSDANGATMSITAIHSSAYLTLMQLMTLEAAEYINNPNPRLIGDATMPMILGQNRISSSLVGNIIKGKNYENMADIVYQLLRAVIEGTVDSAVGKYYHSKLGDTPEGWKILKRIYGVSKTAANSAVATYDKQYKPSPNGANEKTNEGKTSEKAEGSRYYTKDEFQVSKQHGDVWNDAEWKGMNKELLAKLDTFTDEVRRRVGGFTKFTITSGFRSYQHNINVGGVGESLHVQGMAVDLDRPDGISGEELYNIALAVGFGGIHYYPNQDFIHVDVGSRRDW